jgi:hypothetical protein
MPPRGNKYGTSLFLPGERVAFPDSASDIEAASGSPLSRRQPFDMAVARSDAGEPAVEGEEEALVRGAEVDDPTARLRLQAATGDTAKIGHAPEARAEAGKQEAEDP